MLSDRVPVDASVAFSGHTCSITPGHLDLTDGAILCGGVPIGPPNWDSSKAYFRGAFPIASSSPDVAELLIYCGGGALRWAILDSSACVIASGTVTWDCATLSGYIDTPISLPCAIGSYTIHINGGSP